MSSILLMPMGNSMFLPWSEVDSIFDHWAKSYFGNTVKAEGGRDINDCYIIIEGLKSADFDKFAALYPVYDTEGNYEPEHDFEYALEFRRIVGLLPECFARGILAEALKQAGMNSVETLYATEAGVFIMEKELTNESFVNYQYSFDKKSEGNSLDEKIHDANAVPIDSRLGSTSINRDFVSGDRSGR